MSDYRITKSGSAFIYFVLLALDARAVRKSSSPLKDSTTQPVLTQQFSIPHLFPHRMRYQKAKLPLGQILRESFVISIRT